MLVKVRQTSIFSSNERVTPKAGAERYIRTRIGKGDDIALTGAQGELMLISDISLQIEQRFIARSRSCHASPLRPQLDLRLIRIKLHVASFQPTDEKVCE